MSDENNCFLVPFLHFPGGMLCLTEESDDKLLCCEVNNPVQRHYFDRYKPMHLAQQIEWRQSLGKRADTNQAFKIVVEEKVTIGTMGIGNIDWKNRTAVTGAMMFNSDYWGKGYGRKAKMVLLNHAFNRLNLEVIESRVLEFNTRSYNYSIACGYVQDAFLPGRHLIEENRYGEYVLSATRETWEPKWEKFRKEHQIESFEEMLARTMKKRDAE